MSIDRQNPATQASEVSESSRTFSLLLFFFALSFTFFAIQSGDVLMYLSFARDFLLKGQWPDHDPYLYSLPHAPLYIAHEYLSYLLFYSAWWLSGFAGLIVFKMLVLSAVFALVLTATPHANNRSPLWIGLWILAVIAASFRFIERSSLFSDLFCVWLAWELTRHSHVNRKLIVRISLLFLIWPQLHPGFPLGFAMLGLWVVWHCACTPDFRNRRLLWLLIPGAVVLINPLGLEGALYPFRFALNEALVLKRSNFEWFPAYHRLFRFTPEVMAFWLLSACALVLIARKKAWLSWRAILSYFCIVCASQAVRFLPWASFTLVLLIKPWAEFHFVRLPKRATAYVLASLLLIISGKNFIFGYNSSSGPRTPTLALDPRHFPIHTVEVLRAHPQGGRLYNSHDFGSYLIWTGHAPIFHHGFVTDMDFYAQDVVGVFESQARFLELARKYGWTMLLVEKYGNYQYFYNILSPLTQWKIVAEDEASYLIYDLSSYTP